MGRIKKDVVFMSAENITITALWEKITAQIEIVFDTKGFTDEKIEEIVKQYIDTEFSIIKVDDGETGEIKVIIEFASIEKAEEFVRNLKASVESRKTRFKWLNSVLKDSIHFHCCFVHPFYTRYSYFINVAI